MKDRRRYMCKMCPASEMSFAEAYSSCIKVLSRDAAFVASFFTDIALTVYVRGRICRLTDILVGEGAAV